MSASSAKSIVELSPEHFWHFLVSKLCNILFLTSGDVIILTRQQLVAFSHFKFGGEPLQLAVNTFTVKKARP